MPGLGEISRQILHTLQPLCESICVVRKWWGLPMMNLHIEVSSGSKFDAQSLEQSGQPWNSWMKRTFDLLFGSI